MLESQSLAIAAATTLLGILAWGKHSRNRRASLTRAEERHQAAISAAISEYPELAICKECDLRLLCRSENIIQETD